MENSPQYPGALFSNLQQSLLQHLMRFWVVIHWPTGCSENSKGRGEFSKVFYLQSALIFYFVFDFSVLLLESPSSNRLDFGFELSALGSHWLLDRRLLRVCLRRRVEVSKQWMGEGTRGPLRSQCADWNHRWKWQAIKQCTNAAKAI